MAVTAFQVLDKAIASDSPLGKSALIGKGKDGDKLLEELCQSGCLSKSAGSSPKYNLTPHGREVWQGEAPPERRQQVQAEQQRKQREKLIAFLRLVEKNNGKGLSKPEQQRYPESLLQDAVNRKLVETGAKAYSYRLLPTGEEMLLSELPVEKQLQRLRELQSRMVAPLRAIHRQFEEELTGLDGEALPDVRSAQTELRDRGEQASQAFDALLTGLSAFPLLLSAAQRLQARQRQLNDQEARLLQSLQEQRKQLEAFEQRMQERFHEWSSTQRTTAENAPSVPPAHAEAVSPPQDAAVWEAARTAANLLKQETFRLGGIVKVPELTDAVRRTFPDLAPAALHELLRKWQQEDRLTLQLCNDPRLESRAAEGIATPRGLLFYVQLR